MEDYRYLKDEQYYNDRYDLFTIKDCLELVQDFQEIYQKSLASDELKEVSQEEKLKATNYMLNMQLYATQANRYKNKHETIEKWVEDDRLEQDKYDNTPEPANISCSDCKAHMQSTFKDLESYMDKLLRMLFFFECPSCKKRKGIYEDGEEQVFEPELCPKCSHEVKTTYKKKDEILTWTVKCSSCGFSETKTDDFAKRRAEREKNELDDKELLAKYRDEFCLSDEKGKEAVEFFEAAEVASEVHDEERQKYADPVYERSLQLEKLDIVQLEKLLTESFEKERFIKLSLDKPEIGQYVIVPFMVQDADSSRKGSVSIKAAERLLKTVLEKTNWRLMTSAISYRLGYVSGQLKGYEREEDMLVLAGKEKKQPTPKVESELRRKYWSNSLVQLGRLTGEFKGIEDMRKRRLTKEPDGFFLDANEGPYNCNICYESIRGDKTWWNLDGIRCENCWRNIQEGVIPSLSYKNDDDWIKDWQLKSNYGVHTSTRNKLLKEGVLHPRELKTVEGKVYFRVYIVEENKEFFEKYPKQESEMKLQLTKDGWVLGSKNLDVPTVDKN